MSADEKRADRHPLVQQNLLDKLIAYISPAVAKQRIVHRAHLALAGGYTGARIDKKSLSNWRVGAGSPTSDIIADLPMLRARSRDQFRNAPVAVGAMNTAVSHVIGTGLTYTPAIDAAFLGLTEEAATAWSADTARRFKAWAESKDCDVGRRLNFYEIQELSFRTHFESGDAFVVTPRIARAGRRAQLALQVIEADRVCNPDHKGDTETLIDGIELSPETSETIAVHIAKQHPGDLRTAGNTWQRVPVRGDQTGRRNVLHIFKTLRPGQVRGVPWIAPILEPLKQLSRYTDAELKAAVDSAIFSVFVKMDADAFNTLFEEDAQDILAKKATEWDGSLTSAELGTSKAVNLLPGEEIQTHTPGRPNPQFDPFVLAILRQIGVALELPYEVLVMHFQSSYTAARGALLMAWKFFRARREHTVANLCQPVVELWLADEVAEGRIPAPGFFANDLVRAAWCGAVWTGDGPGSIDPGKEVKAARDRVDMEISTLDAESILHDGIPWEVKHRQRVREVAAQKRDGTAMPAAPAAAPAPEVPDPEDEVPPKKPGDAE
jgi:lambda family phage portal protein